MLQAWYRKHNGVDDASRLLRLKIEIKNAIILQRIFRGLQGRIRSKKKKHFYYSIACACESVSTDVLTQADLEALSGFLNEIITDVSREISTSILTVCRGIFFLLNGDDVEWLYVYNRGVYEQKDIYARTLSWNEASLFLLRQSRLLRRVRAISRFIKSPNPQRLKLTDSCLLHLTEMELNMTENNFNDIDNEKAKYCAIKLFKYCKYMKISYDLQFRFPEYFDTAQPTWFTALISFTKKKENDIIKLIQSINCCNELINLKKSYLKNGRKWGAIVRAQIIAEKELNINEINRDKSTKKLDFFLLNISNKKLRKLDYFNKLYRAKELRLDAAIGNYKNYQINTIGFNNDNNENNTKKIELKNLLAEATMSYKETNLMRLSFIENMEKDQNLINFNKNFDLLPLHEISKKLGKIHGILLTENEEWKDFLKKIGGIQYLKNIDDEKINFYTEIKENVLKNLKIENNLFNELNFLFQEIFQSACDSEEYGRKKNVIPLWDDPVYEEVIGEIEEDKLCAFQAGTDNHFFYYYFYSYLCFYFFDVTVTVIIVVNLIMTSSIDVILIFVNFTIIAIFLLL